MLSLPTLDTETPMENSDQRLNEIKATILTLESRMEILAGEVRQCASTVSRIKLAIDNARAKERTRDAVLQELVACFSRIEARLARRDIFVVGETTNDNGGG